MQLLFLGTSGGTPTKERNVSGCAIKMLDSKSWILVDCGEGTQHQILHTPLSMEHLSAICITHVHGDHCYGLPGLLASAVMNKRTKPLVIIAPQEIQTFLEVTLRMTKLTLSFELSFIDVKTITTSLDIGDFQMNTIVLSHDVDSYAFTFYEQNIKAKLNIQKLQNEGIKPGVTWSQLQKGERVTLANGKSLESKDYLLKKREARSIIIAGDNDDPERLLGEASRSDILVHEATFLHKTLLHIGESLRHSSAKKIADLAQKSRINNLILTHFSARYQKQSSKTESVIDIENEAKAHYDGNLFLANDFDSFTLTREGVLKFESGI
jgi:ribonuclease Z